jgi:stage II sporulation protein D
VLGEVPASFEIEALKAQAVAARTYTLRCIQEGDRHPDGAVCTDYKCCQAYCEPDEYLRSGGTQANIDKVFGAVNQTAGQVVCYDGELIYATYFASSGGITEDAREVWGQAFPYLVSVSSPGEKDTAYHGEKLTFTTSEFQERLGVTLQGSPEVWFGKVRYTVGGGVDAIRIGARLYSGLELRRAFGLRSTIFTVSASAETITFETKGYGHRVGLSQYGADAMAVAGYDYDGILAHYYRGTTIETFDQD